MAADISDHCPLQLSLQSNDKGRRHFHFENFCPQLKGFQEAVQSAWMANGNTGVPLERLATKLQATARALQSRSQKRVGSVNSQLELTRELLHRLEVAQDNRVLTAEEAWMRRQLKQHALALASLQRTIARLWLHIHWLSEGDANTEYFHSHARFRKQENHICKLKDGDQLLTVQQDKEETIWTLYNNLLGTPENRSTTLNLDVFHGTVQELSDLDAPISVEEVWTVIKSMAMDKSPGLDGFSGRFYKTCWATIKNDIMVAVGALHGGDARKLHLLNLAFMVLVPKREDAIQISDFRPISMVHSFAKLVTKNMVTRLAKRLNTMIAVNQSAIIKGRSIHDNFMLVQQMAQFLNRQKRPHILLKLDITKAFDTVSWPFLLKVLTHLGFGHRWHTLLCNLLHTSSTRVLNGEPGSTIHHH